MSKLEWGHKHVCMFCGALFYDMQKQDIICPSCHKEHHPEAALKLSRLEKIEDEVAETEDSFDDAVIEGDSDDAVLEDTSELNNDDIIIETAAQADDKDE